MTKKKEFSHVWLPYTCSLTEKVWIILGEQQKKRKGMVTTTCPCKKRSRETHKRKEQTMNIVNYVDSRKKKGWD